MSQKQSFFGVVGKRQSTARILSFLVSALKKWGNMKRIAWIFLGWLVLTTTAFPASFPCSNVLTTVEKWICANEDVSALDERLYEIYNETLESAKFQNEVDGNAIRLSQKKWLKKRNNCKDITCIKNEYEERIDQLSSIYRKGNASLISSKKAESICKEVVELANAGKIKSKLISFATAPQKDMDAWSGLRGTGGAWVNGVLDVDYNRDKKPEHLGFIVGSGTCSIDSIIDLGAAIKRGAPLYTFIGFSEEEVENDDRLRWASWGRSDSFLFVQNEPVVVAANISEYSEDVALVSWFGEGRKRPLCATSALGVKVEIVDSKLPELCNAVANGDIAPLEWVNVTNAQELEKLRSKYQIDKAHTASIDLNADGDLDKVLLLDSSSGAGCGSSRQWLDVLEANATKTQAPALTSVLQNLEGQLSRYSDQWSDIKLLVYANKPYLVANGPSGLGVYSIWKNELHTWCIFHLREQIGVDRLYPPGMAP